MYKLQQNLRTSSEIVNAVERGRLLYSLMRHESGAHQQQQGARPQGRRFPAQVVKSDCGFMALVARAAEAAAPRFKAQQPQNTRNQINPRGASIYCRKTPDVVAYFLAKLQYYVNLHCAAATKPAR